MARFFLLLILLTPIFLRGKESFEAMLKALETTRCCDDELYVRFPVTYNHLLSTGYFTTPSARMAETGEIGLGVAHAPPYLNWNARVQLYSHLELSLNYRIFRGIEDPNLSPHGFGDFADRGANFKVAITTPEDTMYHLPGLAFGMEDFMGSKRFTTYFIVGTQVWRKFGLETSLGWGAGRYTHGPSRGFFGGANWFPLWNSGNKWTKGISLTAEYDPVDYANPEREPHPYGRTTHTPINFGAKYNLFDLLEFSASRIRGEASAFAGSLHYNWGKTEGFIPKIKDAHIYTAPVDTQPLGCYRPESVMIQNLNYELKDQGFQLTKAWIEEGVDAGKHPRKRLWLAVINCRYRQESVFRKRLQYLLAALTPSDVSDVVVIVESSGLPCQQYIFNRTWLLKYIHHQISPYEFDIVTPRLNACSPPSDCSRLIYHKRYDFWRFRISPRFESFFGSSKGKVKYDVGALANLSGFFPYNVFYEFQVSQTVLANIDGIGDFDFLNPSQLPNVATDYIRYRQEGNFSWDRIYLQKNWNFGRGLFGKAALGYFQVNYAGIAGELLWYPTQFTFALGLEGAVVKKRNYTGLGFQSKLRQLDGLRPTFHPYTTLQQYFFDFYLDIPALGFFTKIMVGQFLARDKGVGIEGVRYFDNGVRLIGWITYTNAGDTMHGENYYNRGVAIEIPLDFFYKCSSRRVWSYGMAAWLRDAGYSISTGKSLFNLINRERR
ncbi:MAG: YjbH domain-containing protein [Chlamydiales bacterium]